MAIVKKYNPKQVYISDRLDDKLDSIFENTMTVIETPVGYGKTTAVKAYLNKSGKNYIWFNVDSDNRMQFFRDICAKINSIDETVAKEMVKIGYPNDEATSSKLANAIMSLEFKEKTVLVIDNYDYIIEKNINNVMKDLCGKQNSNLLVVLLSNAAGGSNTFDIVLDKNANYINKEDFQLTKNEIEEYYKLCGIKLDRNEAEFLFSYTEGWFSALYLQMLSYRSTNSFEHTLSIEKLVYKVIWNNITSSEQDFLIAMSIFDNFTIRQALVMAKNIISEEETLRLIEGNGFIEYDRNKRKYYIHAILKCFLDEEFEKQDNVFKKRIYKAAGQWYADNDNRFKATLYYLKNDDYEAILSMDWTREKMLGKVTRSNKEIFMDIVARTPVSIKKKYARHYLVFVLSLFLLNERVYFKSECELVKEFIENDKEMGRVEKNQALGECFFVQSLSYFNDLSKMNEYYIKAFELIGSPTKLFRGYNLLCFENPSVLCTFHREGNSLSEEISLMEEVAANYYNLTEGNSKGIETLLKAEALYNEGNLKDAGVLCEKAKYKAESRKQTDIVVMVLLLQARLALMNGDYNSANKHTEEMNNLVENDKKLTYKNLVDMSKSFLSLSYDNADKIPVWITDSMLIEENMSLITLGFANLVYGRYLLVKEEYSRLLAISGQMLDLAGIFSNVMYMIYTYIYIAVAKNSIGESKKAVELFEISVELANKDNIVMPFVENYEKVMPIIDKCTVGEIQNKNNLDFINHIKGFIKKYSKSIEKIKRESFNTSNFGLTKRELEIAKLAAKRMTNKEIADNLFIAESTVKSTLKIIFSKLSINSRNDLADYFKEM